MKIFITILLLMLCLSCETTKVTDQPISYKGAEKVTDIPISYAGAEEEYIELLEKGIQTLSDGNTKESIEKYFDPIIEYYNNSYKNYEKRVYCARESAETLFYLNESIKQNEMAIVIKPVWPQALYYKAYANIELGNIADAKTSLKKALVLSPSNPNYLSELGYIYQVERKWVEAAELYKKAEESALKYSPKDLMNKEMTKAMRGRGYILIELGRLDEAEKIYKKCLEIDEKDKNALDELEYIRSLRNKTIPNL